jgi:hypothetical protein
VLLSDPGSLAPDRFVTFPFVNIGRRHDRAVAAGWAWGGTQDNTQYGSEQILSTLLFRVYRSTGGDDAVQTVQEFAARYLVFLIIKAIGTLTVMTTNPEVFANALMDADESTVSFEGHPGGAWHKVIRWSFEQQGLYQPAGAPTPVAQAGAPPDSTSTSTTDAPALTPHTSPTSPTRPAFGTATFRTAARRMSSRSPVSQAMSTYGCETAAPSPPPTRP